MSQNAGSSTSTSTKKRKLEELLASNFDAVELVHPPKSRSSVWEKFGHPVVAGLMDKCHVVCRVCHHVYAYNSSTGNAPTSPKAFM